MLSYDRSRPVLLSRFRGAPLCRIGVSAVPQITTSIAHDDAPARSLRPNPKRVQAKRARKVSRARVVLELATPCPTARVISLWRDEPRGRSHSTLHD